MHFGNTDRASFIVFNSLFLALVTYQRRQSIQFCFTVTRYGKNRWQVRVSGNTECRYAVVRTVTSRLEKFYLLSEHSLCSSSGSSYSFNCWYSRYVKRSRSHRSNGRVRRTAKATINFGMSALSFRMERLDSHWAHFQKI
jgi:hypothetical protein